MSIKLDKTKLQTALEVYPRPHLKVIFFDDFLRAVLGDNWLSETSGSGSVGIQNLEGGVVRLVTGTTSGSVAAIYNGGASYLLYNPTKNIAFEERIRLPGALTDLTAWFGLSTLDGYNHIMWCARPDVSPNFRCESMVGGVTYGYNTDVPLDNNWHILRIETSSSNIKFYIDDVLKWTTDKVPTTLQCIELYITNTVAASRELDIDWVYIIQDR